MRRVFTVALLLFAFNSALAQFDDPAEPKAKPKTTSKTKTKSKPKAEEEAAAPETLSPRGVQLDQEATKVWRCGLIVKAVGGPCGGLFGTIAVPTDWPEQQVRIVNEDITPNVKHVRYRVLEQGVKQMLIDIPSLEANETAKATVAFEVVRHSLKAPPDTSIFVMPERLAGNVKKHLGPSPLIESNNFKFKKLAQELIEGKSSAWEQVEAIYDGTRAKVKWENDKEKGALAALNDAKADKEDLTGVFIALCRSIKVPARLVWVPDSVYAEFYLEDAEGAGYWIPCYVANEKKEFGFISSQMPILQKGDNFKVPEKKEPQRFVAEFLTGKGNKGGKPLVEFLRRQDFTINK